MKNLCIASVVFGGAAAVAASLAESWILSGELSGFAPAASLAGALCGGATWGLFVRSGRPTALRATFAGAVTAALSYPVMLCLVSGSTWLERYQAGTSQAPLAPFDMLSEILALATWGILFTGWLVLPLGAGAGLLARRLVIASSAGRGV